MADAVLSKLSLSDNATAGTPASTHPATLLLDSFFPGFSLLTSAVYRLTSIDLTIYLPAILATALIIFGGSYVWDWMWEWTQMYLMATADVRIDDEIYNMVINWIARQKFSKHSRHFVANTNLSSRMWYYFRSSRDAEDSEDEEFELDESSNEIIRKTKDPNEKKVQFTPSFGTHYFWYKGRMLIFRRTQDTRQTGWGPVSEREEISISSFGRNPAILKELLDDCRAEFIKNDENRTVIYRGGLKSGTAEPSWTRCVSRASRPFSTVVLDEKVKADLLADMEDYLHPFTRRWYSNRGIPYRRGYLLHGPPGTGKSSLSFAIAGIFKLKIYIVSLNSPAMNEENLSTLFTDLPKQCVVLLEDIDTAGLTHTRRAKDDPVKIVANTTSPTLASAAAAAAAKEEDKGNAGRISLSGLLNVLDGVASQEGRVLIMTTNHIENLDEALIRPGRVDMTIEFSLATTEMITTIFRSIFATLEGDIPSSVLKLRKQQHIRTLSKDKRAEAEKSQEDEEEAQRKAKVEEERIKGLGEKLARKIPTLTFSPAEVQGYLLKHKMAPERAVEGAEEWVKYTQEERRKKKEKEAAAAKKAALEEEAEKEKEKEEKKKESEDGGDKAVEEGKEKKASQVNGVKKGRDDDNDDD